MTPQDVLALIDRFTFSTMGCTDPVAISLAVARAYEAVGGTPRSVKVRAGLNVFKDAVCVGIPGTGLCGIRLAAALGLFAPHPEKGLLVLEGTGPGEVRRALDVVGRGMVECEAAPGEEPVFVEATVVTSQGTGHAVIRGAHDNVVEVARDGVSLLEEGGDRARRGRDDWGPLAAEVDVAGLLASVEQLDCTRLQRLVDGMEANLEAASAGIRERAGMGLGAALSEMRGEKAAGDSIADQARRLAAGAADARMGGLAVPIFGCFGSGNHGIVLTSAVYPVARELKVQVDAIKRALALGVVVIGYVKSRTGVLTPHCGCGLAAATGAAASICHLLGGGPAQVSDAAQLVIGCMFGVLCDGAKNSCAMKISQAAGCAVEMGYAARRGCRLDRPQGIVAESLSGTLEHVRTMTSGGYGDVDRVMVRLLAGRG